jgi:nicotinamidase-related amidase
MTDAQDLHSHNGRLPALLEPTQCAVLMQELQEGVVGSSSQLPELAEIAREAGLLAKAAKVAAAARRVGVPVLHCTAENLPHGFGVNTNAKLFVAARKLGMDNAPGSAPVHPCTELGSLGDDIVLPRFHGLSPMTGSSLDPLLRNEGVRTVIVLGVSLNLAIPNLVFDAVNRSYQVILVSDAVAGVPMDYGRQVVEHTLSLVSTLATVDEIEATWSRQPTVSERWDA